MQRSERGSSVRKAFVMALLVLGCGCSRASVITEQMSVGASVAAQQICSLVFISRLELDRARELYVDPLLRGGARLLRVDADSERKSVTASFPGVGKQLSIYREGYGCTPLHDEAVPFQRPPQGRRAAPLMDLDPRHRDLVFDTTRLQAALEASFAQEPGKPPVNTLAVVVLHEGRLVAERYADGITPSTRLPGWSMSKSVTAALVGILADRGTLAVRAPGALGRWRGTDDPRGAISLNHLLRMTSGIDLPQSGEGGDGLDPTYRMLYREFDAAGFAAARPLAREVGVSFEYTDGHSVLAMRAVQDAVGGGLEASYDFIHGALFDPLGMQTAILEPDQSGTFLASSRMYASAQQWARFGQLFVDQGMVGERRVLSENWIAYMTEPTKESSPSLRSADFWERDRSSYGAGFWRFSDEAGLPRDAIDANGFQGQYLHIIPSEKLVVVRLGATNFRDYDHQRLPRDLLAARRTH